MLRYRVTGGRDVPAHDELLEIEWTSVPAVALERGARRGAVRRHAVRIGGGPARSGARGHRRRRPADRRGATGISGRGDRDGRRTPDRPRLPRARHRAVGRARSLTSRPPDGLTDRPLAAVALEVADDGTHARIVHRGSEPIEVDVSALRIAVLAWQGYYEPREPGNAGRWTCRAAGRSVRAGRGPPVHARPPHRRRLRVAGRGRLRAADDDEWRRVGVVRVPVIESPEASRSVD